MATITGKRFQITDGASTPTNLFPYTVTEAVYGLSTVIENAKTAVISVLSAVTLNGVSKAGTTASFYAPTTAGTTGQILKATTSGAPVWTSAALGASNKPIYLNSSGVLTEGVSCLPLSAGADYPLTDTLIIRSGNDYKIILDNTDTDTNYQGISFRQNGTEYGKLGVFSVGSTNLQWSAGGVFNTIYHAGNSNLSTVDWTCKKLTASGNATIAGNVGIGTDYPSQKLHVVGNLLSTGDQVVSSDATLKTNLADITYSVADIAKAPAVTFDWKDGRGRSAGSIAQYWKNVLPELVHGEEGNMSLAYGQLALVNTIIEAREIETLKARVAELEAEVKRLRMN